MKERVLVTGGTGFLGSAFAKMLLDRGIAVRIFDNQWRKNVVPFDEKAANLEVVTGDIRDEKAVAEACEGMTQIFHFAFVNGTQYFYSDPDLVLDVAITGMMNVLKGAMAKNVGTLFLASSSEVYQSPARIPTDETAPLSIPDVMNPRYSYAGGKIMSELVAVHYGKKYLERVVIFRPHNVYGPNMGHEHVIPQFILRMQDLSQAGKEPIAFPIQGTGKETRAFIFVDDFTSALEVLRASGKHLNIYHVGTMEERTIEEVAREVAACFGKTIKIQPGERTAGSPLRRCPDVSKLHALGYREKVSFREGVERTVRWYNEHGKKLSH